MAYELGNNDGDIDQEMRYFRMPIELYVTPPQAREYISRLFNASEQSRQDILHRLYEQGDWGSHIDRAVLSIAVESDEEADYDLVERIANEMVAQPQQLSGMAGISMSEAAKARSRMALFDARRQAHTETPTLEQFISFWR